MYEAVFVTPWPWWAAGSAIGLVVTLLAWLLGKPLGVSTGFGRRRSSGDAARIAPGAQPAP